MKKILNNIIALLGYQVLKKDALKTYTLDIDADTNFNQLYNQCKPYTMTSVQRMFALHQAIEYVVKNNIDGDMVECGVWRGGSSMMTALTLLRNNKATRQLYLYDTFEGMSEPTDNDVNFVGESAFGTWDGRDKCLADLEDVQTNMALTKYKTEKISFIKGKVEDTIPQHIPEKIALLRLDTDWYESTYHELVHLFPRLVKGGVLIIDDYGHWVGAKKAVDDYFSENNIPILLNRIDYTGRIAIKV